MSEPLPTLSDADITKVVGEYVLDAVIVATPDSRVVFWNRAAERMFGRARGDVIGRNMHDLITPERYRERAKAGFEKFSRIGTGPLIGQVVRIEALRADGREFPVELALSSVRLSGIPCAVGVVRDDSARADLERELKHRATTDPLTGILNRRAFFERAPEHQARAQRYGHPVAVIALDLDRFKSINDTHGHAIGDEILRVFVATAGTVLRATDVFGRMGGEEFAILLPETDLTGAASLAERLRARVAEMEHASPRDPIRMTVSAGVTSWKTGAEAMDDALRRADEALYRAKKEGRNRVVTAPAPA